MSKDWRLTDEEIGAHRSESFWNKKAARLVADAQAKKLWEWGIVWCEVHQSLPRATFESRFECPECQVQLRKDMGL